jgi:hypothetical protein
VYIASITHNAKTGGEVERWRGGELGKIRDEIVLVSTTEKWVVEQCALSWFVDRKCATKKTNQCGSLDKLLILLVIKVARDRIELPTRGFSVGVWQNTTTRNNNKNI